MDFQMNREVTPLYVNTPELCFKYACQLSSHRKDRLDYSVVWNSIIIMYSRQAWFLSFHPLPQDKFCWSWQTSYILPCLSFNIPVLAFQFKYSCHILRIRLGFHCPLARLALCHLPYVVRQRITSPRYNHPLASLLYNALCKTLWQVPEF